MCIRDSRQAGAVGEGEEGGEQGVPAQEGEEPGGSRGGDADLFAVRARRRDLERGQVRQAPGTGRGQFRPARREGDALYELAFQGQ